MIEVKNLYKSFDGNLVLNNISTRFEKGKTNLIIGRSGSGKTVLLKSILGLYEIDEGEIWYDKRNFIETEEKKRKKLRQEIGMVFQGGALFDSITVEANIRFPLDMFTQMTSKEKKNRVNFCLDHVNIEKTAHKLFPSEISGGMQKRVAIARAIALNPKYLFCDEPNSGLDPETATVIDKLIQDLTKEFQMTTIINTHDMNSVIEIGESVLFISKGEKEWVGTKHEILNSGSKKLNDFIFANKLYAQMKKGENDQ
ncbi:MAG: ATP-binding cassette domain-containing protein [Prolixibacteraceae bacterium]|jgi:phospholipid/cholesterol/gamma-HCH transport system ATP-binding protein|nr:ATP-binding cassette domain-containing protein [Prolixibacteraceae bacterium]MBT6004172.1 ATP-binding cassette domain-containing protein [Prolixibacteraceae bacterium]MBT6764972.1 ATP-binding cassette domain-containing protein [Prolixibacteraceae bacterium]MBT6997085.1 ATP-binding cassette domain-containing protein [Prolixibacteraceae bacterium]MBT7393382.1 ATP-binding cassette domain-containing protein [Prolixibacteraceae bacterium]